MAILLFQFNLDGEMERMEIEDLGMYLRNLVVRNSAFGLSDQPVKPQKLVNGSKFWIAVAQQLLMCFFFFLHMRRPGFLTTLLITIGVLILNIQNILL